jgi:hypothetical protein
MWLQNWLVTDPARLGLGQVRVVAQELTAPRGGSLDILAADGDTYLQHRGPARRGRRIAQLPGSRLLGAQTAECSPATKCCIGGTVVVSSPQHFEGSRRDLADA